MGEQISAEQVQASRRATRAEALRQVELAKDWMLRVEARNGIYQGTGPSAAYAQIAQGHAALATALFASLQ